MPRTEVTGLQIKDATVSLTADVTGILPVANGGSGSNTLALNNVVLGNGTGAVQTVAPSTAGNLLTSDGTTWASTAPSFLKRSVSTITSNTTAGSAANTDYIYFANLSSDAYYSSVTALLHGDGTNNSTTITDNSSLASNWNALGNAKVSTTLSKFGGASINFDGTNSYLYPAAASSNFAFGSADFTLEFWLYQATGSAQMLVDFRPTSTNGIYISLSVGATGTLLLLVNNSTVWTGSAGAAAAGSWHHIAMSRSGTSTRIFVDGTQTGTTYSDSNAYLCGTNRPVVGTNGLSIGATWLSGYIDDIRITKGVARYTANFTAPTAAFPNGASSMTLPTAVGNTNLYTIKNIHSLEAVTVNTTSSQTVDGTAPPLSIPLAATTRIVSDGSNWRTI